MDFEWNETKRKSNIVKHGIDFVAAIGVFDDPRRVEGYDETHSEAEDRWWTIGLCKRSSVLFVVFTERAPSTVRIISARRATRREEEAYYAG